jgi:RNA polymerase primary sigma factor
MIGTERTHPTSTPLEMYLRQINSTPLLSAPEEQELTCRVQEGDSEARDHLIRANLRLVVSIARRYQGRGVDLSDLVAEGNLGLLRAVEGFDTTMGTRFTTYAAFWIRQSVSRAVINSGRTIRLPAYLAQLLSEWRRVKSRLEDELCRPPTEAEVAERLKVRPRQLRLIKKALRIYNAMPQGDYEGQGESLDSVLADDRAQAPDAVLGQAEELQQVLQLVEGLEPREQTVLRLRFGLGGQQPMNLKEIGEQLGLTRERVRQIEQEALSKLNNGLANG